MSGYGAFGITPQRRATYHRSWDDSEPEGVMVIGYVEDDNERLFVCLDEDGRCRMLDIESVVCDVPELEPIEVFTNNDTFIGTP